MRGGTLFSGIGAPEIAMPWVDWRWHAEIEKFPAAVHAARFGTESLGDVTKTDWRKISREAPIDLLVFGSPCQSFSVAGKRLGLDDPRGNLALVALGVAEKLRPDWLVFENVPGLLSSDNGRDFGAFLWLLEQCGYGWAYRVLDAQFAGVPQRRRRIFLVGHLGDWRRAAAVLFEPESLRWDTAPRREAGERVAGSIAARTKGGGGLGTDFDLAGGIQVSHSLNAKGGSGRIDGESETFVTGALMADHRVGPRRHQESMLVTHSLRADGFDASEDGTGRGTPLVCAIQERAVSENAANGPDGAGVRTDGQSYTLEARTVPQAIAFTSKDHGADAGGIAPTLRSMGHDGSHANGGGQVAVAFQASAVRRLTPR